MRIGVMLRTLDEKGGIGVYSRYLTEELLTLDSKNEYVLFYRNPAHLGFFNSFANVQEQVVIASNKAFWDQLAVPYACSKAKVNVLFHPKFTVPLHAPCKSVMVVHGAGWFMPDCEKFWSSRDRRYIRLMMPVYCRRAAAVISVSQITTDIFNQLFHIPAGKIKTVYFGPGKHFRRVESRLLLQVIREKYRLPDRFILTLAKYGDGGRKNTRKVIEAFHRLHGQIPHQLVVLGKDAHRLREDYQIPSDGYGKDIHFTGWVDQEDLPGLYSLSDLFLYPSNVEAFPIPVTEAMACGIPIITSDANGLKEIAGDAALLVDPKDPREIASATARLLSDSGLRSDLSQKALLRSRLFCWERCANETLSILESVASSH